jgi:hypothetical protein
MPMEALAPATDLRSAVTAATPSNKTLISMITTDPKSIPYFYTNTEAIDIDSGIR